MAEYRAPLAGLVCAGELGLTRVVARSHSRMLIDQVSAERHVRNPTLRVLEAGIADRRMRIGTVVFE